MWTFRKIILSTPMWRKNAGPNWTTVKYTDFSTNIINPVTAIANCFLPQMTPCFQDPMCPIAFFTSTLPHYFDHRSTDYCPLSPTMTCCLSSFPYIDCCCYCQSPLHQAQRYHNWIHHWLHPCNKAPLYNKSHFSPLPSNTLMWIYASENKK